MSSELTKTSRLRLGPGMAGVRMTAEEFDRARARPGYRYELIGGVLVVSPYPGNGEIEPNEYLGYLLLRYQDESPEGSMIDASLPEQTIPVGDDRRRLDRAIWTGLGRTPDPLVDRPTIAVEFVSKSRRDVRRDYEIKRDEYLGIGIREYWVIDRFRRSMTVYRGEGGRIAAQVVAEEQTYRTDLLPGFALPLAALFKLADRWTTDKRRPAPPAGGRA